MGNIIRHYEINDQIIQVKLLNVEKNSLFVSDIFHKIASKGVNIDMISQVMLEDEMRIDFTCDQKDQVMLNEAIALLKQSHPRIMIYQSMDVAKVMVEGEAMRDTVGVAARIFEVFAKQQIPIYQVTTSEISISYVVSKNDLNKVKDALLELC